jgi:hypothetical protein
MDWPMNKAYIWRGELLFHEGSYPSFAFSACFVCATVSRAANGKDD